MEQATVNQQKSTQNIGEPERQEQARTTQKKALFIEYFRKSFGIVDVSAKAADIERTTVYLWRRTDPTFAMNMDAIVDEMPELVESQLKMAIAKGFMPSVHFYLSRRHPAYKQKIEHQVNVINIYANLTDEQKLERLRRIVARGGSPTGQAKLDLLNGGDIALPENGADSQKGGTEIVGSGTGETGDIPATPGPLENNGDNDQLRNTEIVEEPKPTGTDNQREAG